jgi:hypothetical protein
VKRRRRKLQLNDQQQLIVGLLLVILVAISLLYCLGFASLALREAWQDAPLPWSGTEPPPENLELGPAPTALPMAPSPTSPP